VLVLNRKPGERLFIGDDIIITIVRLTPHNVRIGIQAPKELNVVREEIAERETEEDAE
jgi:carbon storage regulator